MQPNLDSLKDKAICTQTIRSSKTYKDMALFVTESRRIFLSFCIFGLLNNVLYVVILSAAVDLVGSSTPKAVVLLADIIPALIIKALAPFFIHLVPYYTRIWLLVIVSTVGMLIISLSHQDAIYEKVFGIALASLSSGFGEVSFLQLTHYYPEKYSIGGFSTGTGAAGILGSFLFLLLTNILAIPIWITLLSFAVAPLGFILAFYALLPSPLPSYEEIPSEEINGIELSPDGFTESNLRVHEGQELNQKAPLDLDSLKNHVFDTLSKIRPLFMPYMLPLCSVYISEYIINQGISPTLLFPLLDLPQWLFSTYRDIYVVYGFLYQLGVFISRSSTSFGFRVKQLYLLSLLQFLNVIVALFQSLYNVPFSSIWLLLALIFYEGLLGGLLYVNTFMLVSEQVSKDRREFSMGCVGISDSFGIMIAGCINWRLEVALCNHQVEGGREWCRTG